jgi:hypothetical protein
VGGGYRDASLSDLALLWMVGKAKGCGLAFDDQKLRDQVKPDVLGKLHDSMTAFYRPFGQHVRALGRPNRGIERVASSALARQEKDPSAYNPENLVDYVQRGGESEEVPILG